MNYNTRKIEKKWQRIWEKSGIYWAKNNFKKKKSYILVEFPYPSGEGLHVGHCRPYIAFDIISRKRRMEGFNVLFPMGWDAFGLPTENYAVRTGIHPKIATKKNTSFFKRQQKAIGLSFDWAREINTTDPAYYKWTQWIFLQLFKKDLAYKAKMPINWCPSCKIGLANEEVIDGDCERCGQKVTKKEKEQWLLKITKYADRLIQDLDKVDYPEKVKTLQRDWIGRSAGVEIDFKISDLKSSISVFTTRVDTLFGATYLVLAPEHSFVENNKTQIINYTHVKKYVEKANKKTEKERVSEVREKTGIELKGIKAINPVNNREIPIYLADYVLLHYGKGAIMGVPAHDQRDWDFAKKYNLPIIDVIKPLGAGSSVVPAEAYEGEGVLINSDRFSGVSSQIAKTGIAEYLTKKSVGRKVVHYKLRDWIFSRQRYWGEPIPLIFCQKCGWIAVPENDLPVKLPDVKDYKPTEKGDSPLAKVKDWLQVKCPKCGAKAQRETDVMPNWAGSNWYFLRYCDPQNNKKLADPKKLKYWMPVDWYNGGMEHSTLHLLYSRFIYKFLWDIGALPKSLGPEPYKKRTSHGVILGEGGIKMSKSKGNVITPESVISQYGADILRVYEMFMGPFSETIAWDEKGVKGAERFLDKIRKLFERPRSWNLKSKKLQESITQNPKLEQLLHKTIKKITQDIENLRFNTAISALMILANELSINRQQVKARTLRTLLLLLAPFAPHLAEELWQKINPKPYNSNPQYSIHKERWPEHDPKLIKEKTMTLIIQINGRIRDKIEVESGILAKDAEQLAISREKVQKWLQGKKTKKTIFVPGKLINIVV